MFLIHFCRALSLKTTRFIITLYIILFPILFHSSYKELGLSSKPNKGDNGVHASASPFEGLAEKNNWLGKKFEQDAFGKAMNNSGISKATIEEWSVDPQVEQPLGGKGSLFDALEDMNVDDCLAKLVELHKLKDADTI